MENNTSADPLGGFHLHAEHLTRSTIKAMRSMFAITGAFALVIGIALLVWPSATIKVAAVLMAIYFIVDALMRLLVALRTPNLSVGWRVLNILLSLIILIGGIFMIRNTTLAQEVLLLTVVFVVGVSWIVEGILALAESGLARSQGWAITSGLLSLVAGISVLSIPGWSAVMLIVFTGISLVVTGVSAVFRALTFGKDVLKAMDTHGPDVIDGDLRPVGLPVDDLREPLRLRRPRQHIRHGDSVRCQFRRERLRPRCHRPPDGIAHTESLDRLQGDAVMITTPRTPNSIHTTRMDQ